MKKIISVATWLSMLFLIANIHPAHAAGRVGEPVTKAIPFTAPTDPSGRREPIPAKNTQFYLKEINEEWSVFGLNRPNDPIKQVCIAESRADKNFYVQVGINLETYEVFIVIKSLNLKITKTKTTEVYFGLFDKKDQVIVSVVLPAVVMDENRVIVPNFNVKNVSMFLESTNTKIVVKKDDDTAQMINLQSPTPKINDYFLECIEKGGK